MTNIIDKRKLFAYLTAKTKLERNELLSPTEDQLFCDMAGYVLEVDT